MDNEIIGNFSQNTDDDNERKITLTSEDGSEVELFPHETTVISYFGGLAQYNHIHYVDEDEAHYVFEQAIPDDYGDILELAREFEYTEHVNVRKVGQAVIEAFERVMFEDVEDALSVPGDWTLE